LEIGETLKEGAARETVEEAGAQFELGELFSIMSVARVSQVHIFYRARLLSDVFHPGYETMEARLFNESEIPWDEIAFKTVRETLLHYFKDALSGEFKCHQIDID
jgi:ADP-ribose pyrophosphatase YjhB (NUDIX family)